MADIYRYENPPIKNQQFEFYIALASSGSDSGKFVEDPTIAAGDFKTAIGDASFANLTNLPTTSGSDKRVKVVLTSGEMNGSPVLVQASDPDSEWDDLFIEFRPMVSVDVADPSDLSGIESDLDDLLTSGSDMQSDIDDILADLGDIDADLVNIMADIDELISSGSDTQADVDAILSTMSTVDWNDTVEGSVTFAQMFRGMFAILANKVSRAGNTITWRDIADSKNRISGEVDSSGNRLSVSLDDLD